MWWSSTIAALSVAAPRLPHVESQAGLRGSSSQATVIWAGEPFVAGNITWVGGLTGLPMPVLWPACANLTLLGVE